jgi:hypothetical protein
MPWKQRHVLARGGHCRSGTEIVYPMDNAHWMPGSSGDGIQHVSGRKAGMRGNPRSTDQVCRTKSIP